MTGGIYILLCVGSSSLSIHILFRPSSAVVHLQTLYNLSLFAVLNNHLFNIICHVRVWPADVSSFLPRLDHNTFIMQSIFIYYYLNLLAGALLGGHTEICRCAKRSGIRCAFDD